MMKEIIPPQSFII